MIRVLDAERSIAFYRPALGLDLAERVDSDRYGKPFARVFLVGDPDGHQIEVLQRCGRFR